MISFGDLSGSHSSFQQPSETSENVLSTDYRKSHTKKTASTHSLLEEKSRKQRKQVQNYF